ncbi:50S ribosomal protein L5 [Candidatus Woesearchaeota archaeon]|nr:MAG: 50S ribosomal protein L5 [Candidatus Woesearchaeota archaeon]
MNPMQNIRIEKVTLNVGAGKSTDVLDKGVKLLTNITGRTPVRTITQKRIAQWGIRPGLSVGAKVTLRGDQATQILKRLLQAKDNQLSPKQCDDHGNVSFGIPEYIDIPDTKYDPEIGIMGFEVAVTLSRPGFRVKKRRLKRSKIGKNHQIRQEETIAFLKEQFQVSFDEDES